MKTITFKNNSAADVVAANQGISISFMIMNGPQIEELSTKDVESVRAQKLEKILQNGKLAHLRNESKLSYVVLDNPRKLVPFLKSDGKPTEPRFEFNGEYDIFIGDFFKIRTNIANEWNKIEIGYTYVAPILFADKWDDFEVPKNFRAHINLYDKDYEETYSLDFDQFRAFVIGLLLNGYYVDEFFKVDQENRIIYYEIPNAIKKDAFKKIITRGWEVVRDAKSEAKSLKKQGKENCVSVCVYSLLLSYCNVLDGYLPIEQML